MSTALVEATTPIVRDLQAGLSQVLQAVGCDEAVAARELARRLRVDAKLGWRMLRVADERDPLAATLHLPGEAALSRFLESARRHGATAAAIDGVVTAHKRLEAVMASYADSRREFEMLAAANASLEDNAVYYEMRRAAFETAAYTHGFSVETRFVMVIRSRVQDSAFAQAAAVLGFIGLRKLRPHAAWRMIGSSVCAADGGYADDYEPRPLDPPPSDSAQSGTPLWLKYCSDPPPGMQQIESDSSLVEFTLSEHDVGLVGQADIVTAEIFPREAPCRADSDADIWHRDRFHMRNPCRRHVVDMLIEDGLYEDPDPIVKAYSELFVANAEAGYEPRESDRIPLPMRIEDYGLGLLASPGMPGMPTYVAMQRHALRILGLDEGRFRLIRVSVEFPPLPAVLVLEWRRRRT